MVDERPRISITRRVEWDMAHRVPDHLGHCHNLHGHRYAVEVTVDLAGGGVQHVGAVASMVVDFADIKAAIGYVVDQLDHACMLYSHDPLVPVLDGRDGVRLVLLSEPPTAEAIAAHMLTLIDARVRLFAFDARVRRVRVYETPTCCADAEAAS